MKAVVSVNMPKISIIIPTYNRASLLKETLESVISQTYQNWECLVIDDGSTDETETMVNQISKEDNRIQYHKRTEKYKSGGCGARNYGLDLSTGEFINWFDDDDVMLPNFLMDKVEMIQPHLKMIISSHQLVDENLNFIKEKNHSIKNNLFLDYLRWSENLQILTPNILLRKDFLIKNNFRFNETILRGQEAEIFRKIFYQFPQNEFVIVNKPGFLYRQHTQTKSTAALVFNEKFKENNVKMTLDLMDYTKESNDPEIKHELIHILIVRLFESIENSKYLYFFILKELNKRAEKTIQWISLHKILKCYYYFPHFSRVNGKLSYLISKYFNYKKL